MSTLAEVILRDTRANQPAAGSTPAGTLYYVTDESVLERCSGSAWEAYAPTGLTNPMTTAGDIIYGASSGTPARLGKGTDGQFLMTSNSAVSWATVGGGGISSGTSFPGGPSSGDLFYRTDKQMLYTYDGTRWVCTCPHTIALTGGGVNADNSTGGVVHARVWPQVSSGDDLFIEDIVIGYRIRTTNSGSAYWTFTAYKVASAGTSTELGNITTAAESANVFYSEAITVDAVLDISADPLVYWASVKTGSPGNIDANAVMTFRYIAT